MIIDDVSGSWDSRCCCSLKKPLLKTPRLWNRDRFGVSYILVCAQGVQMASSCCAAGFVTRVCDVESSSFRTTVPELRLSDPRSPPPNTPHHSPVVQLQPQNKVKSSQPSQKVTLLDRKQPHSIVQVPTNKSQNQQHISPLNTSRPPSHASTAAQVP